MPRGTLTAVMGEMAEKVENLRAEGYGLEVRTPLAVIGVRGTTFHVFADRQNTSLTVVEGEVELSDLDGNTVTVRENQYSFCSSTLGLQAPVEAPFDVEKQPHGDAGEEAGEL
ncbi:MAG: hypothetical protein MAG715_01188 [Methanonatronarchaeales archaeon]|nr:hypothetical protein [Methanonatronarchaeales archaeon]